MYNMCNCRITWVFCCSLGRHWAVRRWRWWGRRRPLAAASPGSRPGSGTSTRRTRSWWVTQTRFRDFDKHNTQTVRPVCHTSRSWWGQHVTQHAAGDVNTPHSTQLVRPIRHTTRSWWGQHATQLTAVGLFTFSVSCILNISFGIWIQAPYICPLFLWNVCIRLVSPF